MRMKNFYDVTLRDGNHAIRHSLSPDFVKRYCSTASESDVWAVEVGHGNGLGASSYLVGESKYSDYELLEAARNSLNLGGPKLAVHTIPGFATIKRDLIPAIDLGVEIFRVATHVSEASVAKRHIEYLANKEVIVHGVLMMSHMIDIRGLIHQIKLMESYGATAIILMDSAGYFLPVDVENRIKAIKLETEVSLGFHAHNNLGVAVSNAETAIKFGAEIIDGASMGFGAGAGNAQLENILATRLRLGDEIDIAPYLRMSLLVEEGFMDNLPRTTSSSTQSGLSGVFSGYAPQVKQISAELGLDVNVLWHELGKRNLVAGQESMIREVAQDLMNL